MGCLFGVFSGSDFINMNVMGDSNTGQYNGSYDQYFYNNPYIADGYNQDLVSGIGMLEQSLFLLSNDLTQRITHLEEATKKIARLEEQIDEANQLKGIEEHLIGDVDDIHFDVDQILDFEEELELA